jgi:hypothetical protein
VDNDPGGVSEIVDECRRVSEGCQRARCGWGNFEAGRSAVAGGKFEPDEGFQPSNARFVFRGRSGSDVVPEGEELQQEVRIF